MIKVVGFALGNSGKNVNEEYHRMREMAVSKTYTIDEWSENDIDKFDLQEKDFSGKDVDRNYVFNHPVADDEIDVSGFDVRDIANRGER